MTPPWQPIPDNIGSQIDTDCLVGSKFTLEYESSV